MENICAFCKTIIEPNFYNACEDCYQEAVENPEAFVNKVLSA